MSSTESLKSIDDESTRNVLSIWKCSFLAVAKSTLVAILALAFIGCSAQGPQSNYGHSTGRLGRGSPGGYSVFREYCKENGFRTSTIESLTSSVRNFDVIVWAPDSFNEHRSDTIIWLEDWLSQDGKTLVYIGRDYSAYADVLEQSLARELRANKIANSGPPKSVTESVKSSRQSSSSKSEPGSLRLSEKDLSELDSQAAVLMNLDSLELLEQRLSVQSIMTLPWALHDLRNPKWKLAKELRGDWSGLLKDKEHRIVYRSALRPYDQLNEDLTEQSIQELNQTLHKRTLPHGHVMYPPATGVSPVAPNPTNSPPSSNTAPSNTASSGASSSGTSPSNPPSNPMPSTSMPSTEEDDLDYLDMLEVDDVFQLDYIKRLKHELRGDALSYLSETLLESKESGRSSTPLLSRLTRNTDLDYYQATESQIFVVSTPSLLSNYSLTFDGNRAVGKELIAQFAGKQVGFISKPSDPIVRSADYREDQKGFEFFTKWPMSLISLHAALAGAVVLFALFPILGRPKKLPSRSAQDFSQHIVALGELLEKSDDHAYAKRVIGDYFRTVKKDTHSSWAEDSSTQSEKVQSNSGPTG